MFFFLINEILNRIFEFLAIIYLSGMFLYGHPARQEVHFMDFHILYTAYVHTITFFMIAYNDKCMT